MGEQDSDGEAEYESTRCRIDPGHPAERKARRKEISQLKPWIIGAALTLGIGGLAGNAMAPPPTPGQEGSPWLSSYEAAMATARESGKPVFLVFR